MIPITLFKKFSSLNFTTSIKVFYMIAHSSKSYKLRNIHSIRGTTWNKGKFSISKSKSPRLSKILEETKPLEIDRP